MTLPVVGDIVKKGNIRRTVTRVRIIGSNEDGKRDVEVDNGETWENGTYTVEDRRVQHETQRS